MKILFITYHFAPHNQIGAVRCSKTAKYLVHAGDELRVLTAANKPFPETLPLEIDAESVRYLPCPHLDKVAHGVSVQNQTKQNQAGPVAPSSLLMKGLRKFYNLYKLLTWYPDNITVWRRDLMKAARKEVEQFRPDVILASGPPYTPLIVASKISQETGIPWVCELRDLWVDNHNYPYPSWRRYFEQKLENRTLSNASAFITVSEPLSDKLKSKYPAPVHVIPNGFDPVDFPDRRDNLFVHDELHLIYTGVIYKGKQDITPLLEAIAQVGRTGTRVCLHLYGRSLSDITVQAQELGIQNSVKYYGNVPYQKSLAVQRSADALILLNWNDPEETGVYSGKLFEYLGAKRPIICIGTNRTVASDLILERGVGWFTEDSSKLADILMQLYHQKISSGEIKDVPASASTGFTRQEQTLRIREILSETLKGGRG